MGLVLFKKKMEIKQILIVAGLIILEGMILVVILK